MTTYELALTLGLFATLFVVFTLKPRRLTNLPPGPAPTSWLVGNRNQVPQSKPWKWFQELNERYGPVVYLQLGRTPTVVLGSAQAAWDILEKKSPITSARPRFIMGQEIMSNNMRGLMASSGPLWKRWRRVLHGAFMQKTADTYRPIQSLESKQLMAELLKTPAKYREHLERYATSVIVVITYGRRVHNIYTDEVVCRNRETQQYLISINIPGKYLVESIPALLYLPNFLTPWRTAALQQRAKDIKYLTRLVNEVKSNMEAGRAQPSFCRKLLEDREKNDMTDLEIAYTCATPFGAGVETSAGSLSSFMLACVAFGPTFIPRAQAELDSVVGFDRLPSFSDYDSLPFIRAIVNETLRWRPVAVLGGTPHASTEDLVYEGMYIPKGSTIIANLWGIHLNPVDFPDPHTFNPDRFMEARDYPGPWQHSSFGYGRRVCPGMYLAANSTFINIARILWGFNVCKARDDSGQEIEVDTFAYTDGFNSVPLPFPVSITPRSLSHEAVIMRENEVAQEEMCAYDH
ncbi:Cytochrome P450 [Mycena indigotica]|uniref:Cytochrome P450 n=1 Tax=Mycena indigotica TaxID=2126181 RepID=A0A8H6VPT9_9AGAR|nr:Cytochrome P450 [Mycena indigotica]KAF7289244.1 Cytochrome P450 [Mycena indigotica]